MRRIACRLGYALATISDELRRNRVNGSYIPEKAQHKAYVRRRNSKYQGMKIVAHTALQDFVEKELYGDQSPEAIAGRLKKHEKQLPCVSKESIRRYIKSPYGRLVEQYRQKRKRRKRYTRTKPWKDRRFIDKRPAYINDRSRVGDSEGDFIVSGKAGRGILLVIVDRKLRMSFLEQILMPSCGAVTRACLRIKKRYPEWHSMTTDNDLLFQHHKTLEKKLHIKIYFCFPGHAWEKGTVENTNKRIRRDVPKKSNISKYSKRYIRKLEEKLNHRFMQVLEYRTPYETLDGFRIRKKRRCAS